MRHDLSDNWEERLLYLESQVEREPASVRGWHWHGEARVLRFLLRRYGEIELPCDAATSAVAASAPELSALEKSLLRLALIIPNVASKHARPAPRERADILERIKVARDEGRQIEGEESWRATLNAQTAAIDKARRKSLELREREERERN